MSLPGMMLLEVDLDSTKSLCHPSALSSHQTKSNPYFCVLCGSGAWQPAQILVRSPRGGGLDSSGATKISANGCSGLRALDLIRR